MSKMLKNKEGVCIDLEYRYNRGFKYSDETDGIDIGTLTFEAYDTFSPFMWTFENHRKKSIDVELMTVSFETSMDDQGTLIYGTDACHIGKRGKVKPIQMKDFPWINLCGVSVQTIVEPTSYHKVDELEVVSIEGLKIYDDNIELYFPSINIKINKA